MMTQRMIEWLCLYFLWILLCDGYLDTLWFVLVHYGYGSGGWLKHYDHDSQQLHFIITIIIMFVICLNSTA